MHEFSEIVWSRRRFLGAGLLAAGALVIPSEIVRAATIDSTVVRRRELWAMGGWNFLEVTADSSVITDASMSEMVEAIREIDRLFSAFDSRSPVAKLNAHAALNVAIDDPLVFESVAVSLHWARVFGGVFDPTVEPIMGRMGFRDAYRVCAAEKRLPLRDWGYERVECDLANARILRESRELQIDSGGWAKGLAAERAARAAIGAGASTAQVSCGGDIFRADTAGRTYWECTIRDPSGSRTDRAARVRHRFPTVATSGNTESFRIAPKGRRIGHLMDPRTGCPADSDLLSVTVFGHDGLSTDAASSALFVMGKTEAIRWLSTNPQFGAVLIDYSWPHSPEGLTLVGQLERT